jgi:outer membrane biosynthesis protein TonB
MRGSLTVVPPPRSTPPDSAADRPPGRVLLWPPPKEDIEAMLIVELPGDVGLSAQIVSLPDASRPRLVAYDDLYTHAGALPTLDDPGWRSSRREVYRPRRAHLWLLIGVAAAELAQWRGATDAGELLQVSKVHAASPAAVARQDVVPPIAATRVSAPPKPVEAIRRDRGRAPQMRRPQPASPVREYRPQRASPVRENRVASVADAGNAEPVVPPRASLVLEERVTVVGDARIADAVEPPRIVSGGRLSRGPAPFPAARGSATSVELVIDDRGRVESARLTSPGVAYDDERVLAQVRSWRFSPARRAGQPIRVAHALSVPVR